MFDLKYPQTPPPELLGTADEWLPHIDEQGNVVGAIRRRDAHAGRGLLHPVVHLHLISPDGLYLQKRSMRKDIQPGKWDTFVGGHVDYGESLGMAVQREAGEETGLHFGACHIAGDGTVVMDAVGLHNFEPYGLQYVWRSAVEHELISVFFATGLSPDVVAARFAQREQDEVDEVRFWTVDDLRANLGKDIFTPQFEQELPRIIPYFSRNNLLV